MALTATANGVVLMLSALLSLILTQIVVKLSQHNGWVAKPKEDRWHRTPTALFGGVAIAATFAVTSVSFLIRHGPPRQYDLYGLLVGALILFGLGLRDDVTPLNPLVKLLGQVFAAMPFIVGLGLTHNDQWFVIGLPIVLFWMVGLTNAMNLLDNMNGLASGASAIIGGLLAFYSSRHGEPLVAELSALVSASCLGFLYFNARFSEPARIFMGDCGSMFLGYTLAGLVVIGVCNPATSLAATLTVPPLLMALPIFDTSLVIIRRKCEQRAISQGGRDHSSHRLVYAGYTEKHAVFCLYAISAAGGLLAIYAEYVKVGGMLIAAAVIGAGALWMLGGFLSRFPGPQYAAVAAPVLEPHMNPNTR